LYNLFNTFIYVKHMFIIYVNVIIILFGNLFSERCFYTNQLCVLLNGKINKVAIVNGQPIYKFRTLLRKSKFLGEKVNF
jgi:hypothetical protein